MNITTAAGTEKGALEDGAQRQQAVADARAFCRGYSCGWEAALSAHVACALEEGGYPRRVKSTLLTPNALCVLPGPVRRNGAPSAAALALLQVLARESVLECARQTVGVQFATAADVVLQAQLYNATTQKQDQYAAVIRLDDERFPSHAAHFRVMSQTLGLGIYVHKCFVPLG